MLPVHGNYILDIYRKAKVILAPNSTALQIDDECPIQGPTTRLFFPFCHKTQKSISVVKEIFR